MTLYEITEKYKSLLENMQIDEKTGELLNADELEIAEAEFDEKAEAVALYIKNLTALTESIKTECDNLNLRKKQTESKIEQLKQRLSEEMLKAGRNKLNLPRVALSFTKSTETRIIDKENFTGIPEKYINTKTKVEMTPDKTAIKAAILAGEKIDGAELVNKQNLKIK